MSTFFERTAFLAEQVGKGDLVGSVVVDQRYAAWIHFNPQFHHPNGGEAYYLQGPLFEGADYYVEHLARGAITEDGSDLIGAMRENVEDLSGKVFDRAPWEFADLRASGHPSVTSDGVVMYDRPPNVHRLSDEELKAKKDVARLFGTDGA